MRFIFNCISLPNLLRVTKTFTQSMVDVDSEISNVLVNIIVNILHLL